MGLTTESFTAATVEQVRRVAPEGGGVVRVPYSPGVPPHVRGKILDGGKFRGSGVCKPAVYRDAAPGMVFVLELSGNSNTDRGLVFNDLGQRCVDEGVVRTLAPVFEELIRRGCTDVLIRGWNGGHATNRFKIRQTENGPVQDASLGESGTPEVQLGAMPFPCLGYEPKPGWAAEWKALNGMFPTLRVGPWMGRMAAPNVGAIEGGGGPEYRWLTDEGVVDHFFEVIRWHLSLGFRCSGWDEINIAVGSEDEPEDQEWAETPFWGMDAPKRTRGLRKTLRMRFAALVMELGLSLRDGGASSVRLIQEDAEPGGCETGCSLVRVVSRRVFASMTDQQRAGLYCVDNLSTLADKMRGLRLINPGAVCVGLLIAGGWSAAEVDACRELLSEVPGGEFGMEGFVARQIGWGM